MQKRTLLLIALTVSLFASCSGKQALSQGEQQEQSQNRGE